VKEHNLKKDNLMLSLEINLDKDKKADIKRSEQKARIKANKDKNVQGLFKRLFLE
jgi:hypothetical protein